MQLFRYARYIAHPDFVRRRILDGLGGFLPSEDSRPETFWGKDLEDRLLGPVDLPGSGVRGDYGVLMSGVEM